MDALQKRKRITQAPKNVNTKIEPQQKKNSQENNRNFCNPITNYYCIWDYL